MVPPTALARLHFAIAAALLVSALLLGGGQGGLGDTACQLLALLLIAVTLLRAQREEDARLPAVAWLAALPIALPIIQLLPLPEAMWLAAAARPELADHLQAAGATPFHRVSLVPLFTERALAWLLPAVAMFLATLQCDARQRQTLAALVLAVAFGAVVLGLAQLAGGGGGALYFYAVTNVNNAVGFFANSNHHASFLAAVMPLVLIAIAGVMNQRRETGQSRALWLVAGIGLAALLFLGIALTKSRAGLGLGMLAMLLSVPAVMALRPRRGTRRMLALAIAAGLTLSVQFALFGVLHRFGQDPLEDGRMHLTRTTLAAAQPHAPWGTGLGGFRRVFEAADVNAVGNEYINHAHNDAAELWLEGGWPAALLGAPLLLAFAAAGWRAWRPTDEATPADIALRRAAWIALLLVLLHSLVDYPLRTTAHLALFGMLAALAGSLPPARARARARSAHHRSEHTSLPNPDPA